MPLMIIQLLIITLLASAWATTFIFHFKNLGSGGDATIEALILHTQERPTVTQKYPLTNLGDNSITIVTNDADDIRKIELVCGTKKIIPEMPPKSCLQFSRQPIELTLEYEEEVVDGILKRQLDEVNNEGLCGVQ
jgi:hypothetical protein